MAIIKYLFQLVGLCFYIASTTLNAKEPLKFTYDKDVLVLTEETFDLALDEFNNILIVFYTENCDTCKQLKPEYAELATELKANDPPITLAKVDADANSNLSYQQFKFQAFPSILFYKNKELIDYHGEPIGSHIKKFVLKRVNPSVDEIKTQNDLDAAFEKNEVILLGFKIEADHKNILNTLSVTDHFLGFYVTEDKDIAKGLGMDTSKEGIVISKKGEKEHTHYKEESITLEKITEFILEHQDPLIITFTNENEDYIFQHRIQDHVFIFSNETLPYHQELLPKVRQIAFTTRDKLLHIHVPSTLTDIYDGMNIDREKDIPCIVIKKMKAKEMLEYQYPQNGTKLTNSIKETDLTLQDDLLKFENEYLDGKLTVSQIIPLGIDDDVKSEEEFVGETGDHHQTGVDEGHPDDYHEEQTGEDEGHPDDYHEEHEEL